MKIEDKFGRLKVKELLPAIKDKGRPYHGRARVRCECGVEKVVLRTNLKTGKIVSCGCFNQENRLKHGHTIGRVASPTYLSWDSMIQRCSNPKRKEWKNYGGRGIRVCERWLSFENFLADMGERPEGKTIDRYPNNDGNYDKSNCRWATRAEQNPNTRKTHCNHGHEYTEENTYRRPSNPIGRACRECRRISNRIIQQNKRKEMSHGNQPTATT